MYYITTCPTGPHVLHSYEDFGLLLLDDQNGRRIHSIAHQHKDDVNQQRGPQRVDCWQRQASSHMEDIDSSFI